MTTAGRIGSIIPLSPASRFWLAFNDDQSDAAALAWPAFRAVLPQISAHGIEWVNRLRKLPDLASELVDFCKGKSANFRVPRYLRIVADFESIGMTASGKVQKTRLREHARREFGVD